MLEEANNYKIDEIETFIIRNDNRINASATIRIEWFPYARVVIDLISKNDFLDFNSETIILYSNRFFSKLECTVLSSSFGNFVKARVTPVDNTLHLKNPYLPSFNFFGYQLLTNLPLVKFVTFELPNFIDYYGEGISTPDGFSSDFLQFEFRDFIFTLQKNNIKKETEKRYQKETGFLFTHSGSISKKNSSFFSAQDIEKIYSDIYNLFSYLRGARTGPIYFEFFTSCNINILKKIKIVSITKFGHFMPPINLFETKNIYQFIADLNKFLVKNDWGDAFYQVIHWYIESNSQAGGLEGSIILAQVAHELLSWVKFVEIDKIETARNFKRSNVYPAAKKLRMLLTLCSHTHDIPAKLKNLIKFQNDNGLADAADVVTKIRNSLVHAESRDLIYNESDEIRLECWKLSLFYIEILILKILSSTAKLNRNYN